MQPFLSSSGILIAPFPWRHWLGAGLLCLALAAGRGSGQEVLEGKGYVVPPGAPRSSGYTALEAGRDGWIYVGTALYDEGCSLERFNPGTETWERLWHVDQVTGEKVRGLNAQGKVHTKLLVDDHGVVYAGTKRGREPAERKDGEAEPSRYPGGFLLAYDPAKGATENRGILVPGRGLMGGSLDRQRGWLYFWADPTGELVRYDVRARKTWVSPPVVAQPRYTAITPEGVVYMPGKGDTLVRCRPGEERVDVLPLELPPGRKSAAPYTLAAAADGRELLGIPLAGGAVQHYAVADARASRVRVTFGAECSPPEIPAEDVHSAGLGRDGGLYYTVLSRNAGYLARYDPEKRVVTWIKRMQVINRAGDNPIYTQGICVTPDGTLWVMCIYPQRIIGFAGLTAGSKK